MGNTSVIVNPTQNDGRFRSTTDRVYGVLASRSLPTLVRVNLEVKATSLMRRMPKTCRRRLITLREACAMNNESKLHPILTSLLIVRRMAAIGADRGLPLTSLSHMMRTIIMNVETEIHPW